MNYNQKLYYDARSQKFSLFQTDENKVVFETHNRKGLNNGKDEIEQDSFRIEIRTNFWPQAPDREYIYVNIYINNILLLPISKAWRKVASQKLDIAADIFIEEWGNNIGVVDIYPKSPATIVLLRKKIKEERFTWDEILSSICQICNDYKGWIKNEVSIFIEEMQKRQRTHWRRISSALSIIRTYDDIVPEIKDIYRPFFDLKVIECLQNACFEIEQRLLSDNIFKTAFSGQDANILWKYANDYLM